MRFSTIPPFKVFLQFLSEATAQHLQQAESAEASDLSRLIASARWPHCCKLANRAVGRSLVEQLSMATCRVLKETTWGIRTVATDGITTTFVTGNLVRWRGGQLGRDIGVVVETPLDGRMARVVLDVGEELNFRNPTAVLSRVEFAEGAPVVVKNDGSHGGVVSSRLNLANGVSVYRVALPDGSEKVVPEDSLRPAQITNPVHTPPQARRIRRCLVDQPADRATRLCSPTSSTSCRHCRTRASRSSRTRSASSIGWHDYPHRFLLADEVGLGKTIEAGLIIKELKARGIANRVLVLAPRGSCPSGSSS